MRAYRKTKRISLEKMSYECGISQTLLSMIEEGEVTHQNIVARVQKAYKLTDLEAEQLLPIHRRPNGGKYDPELYLRENRLIEGKGRNW